MSSATATHRGVDGEGSKAADRPTPRAWTKEEDLILREAVKLRKTKRHLLWSFVAEKLPGRSEAGCRKRWALLEDPDVCKGSWTHEEDSKLVKGVKVHGRLWKIVAKDVGTRTSRQCATRWSSKKFDIVAGRTARESSSGASISKIVTQKSSSGQTRFAPIERRSSPSPVTSTDDNDNSDECMSENDEDDYGGDMVLHDTSSSSRSGLVSIGSETEDEDLKDLKSTMAQMEDTAICSHLSPAVNPPPTASTNHDITPKTEPNPSIGSSAPASSPHPPLDHEVVVNLTMAWLCASIGVSTESGKKTNSNRYPSAASHAAQALSLDYSRPTPVLLPHVQAFTRLLENVAAKALAD